VLAHQGRQAIEFDAIKDAGERVVRITQQENLGVRLGAGLFELSPSNVQRPSTKTISSLSELRSEKTGAVRKGG